eukprot:GHVN01088483.1.p1 GENE.GHVN01088483.1~~GHVN01088483.1.p1  ORF type:complete len:401 (+),score=28.82 GHVN01088483.1:127-1203(+)
MHALQQGQGNLPFKKVFTYMDMCVTWVDFEDKGVATSFLGFGPDAKCSGAQIFSILAGCPVMAEACGLIAEYEERPADPYMMSANCAERISTAHKNPKMKALKVIGRNDIKTPFMAIQYGGGVPSLRGKKFEPIMTDLGIEQNDRTRNDFCDQVVIAGINEAMGETIGSFIENLRGTVADYCEEHDVDYFSYRHVDGFECTKKGEAYVKMTDQPFRINYGVEGKAVIFGSMESGTGWMIQSRTSGPLQRANFCYYFPVHFIQGIDAVMARKIALHAKKNGLRGYSTIHDQFRSCLADAEKFMEVVVPHAYKEMFIDADPVAKLEERMGKKITWGNPLEERKSVLTWEILTSEKAYYFE